MKEIIKYLKNFSCGFFMGGADVIPGVSGGTIAFILGIYTKWVEAIRELTSINFIKGIFTGKIKILNYLKSENAKFLISLLLGIVGAILILSTPMKYLLENHPVYIWAFFFGLIAGSIIFILKEVKLSQIGNIIAIIIGTIGAYYLVGLVPAQTTNAWYFIIICGALAVSAMILPGISGSFILLILGKYDYIITAVHNLKEGILSGKWELIMSASCVLILFGIGIIVGISLFIKLLAYLLKNYNEIVISAMLGFMVGSMRKIWPFKVGEKNIIPEKFNNEVALAIVLALLGVVIIIAIELLSKLKKQSKE